ncbi:MAG TPA: ABC transporter permease subunit [Thermomicrobiales bacterium]|jgi:ABC-type transport system involved in multi-copper enzyme maturation permease subunit|nr:ABC transporter permease subunit [Thermomicrobiales bacterium]
MGNLLNAEIFKAVKRPATWIMLVILALIVAAFYAIVYFAVDDPATDLSLRPTEIVNNGYAIGANIASILVIVFAAQLMGSEYGWGTIRALASRASSRSALIVSKLILLAGYTLLTLVVTAAVAIISALVFSAIAGNETSIPGDAWVDYAQAIGRYMLANGVYAVLALVITILSRSTAAGIAGGIALSFLEIAIWEILAAITDVFQTIREYFLGYNVQGLAAAATDQQVDDFDITRGVIIVSVWLIALLAISFYVFRRRDITSG